MQARALLLLWGLQEEFMSAYAEQMGVVARQAELQKTIEESSEDMDR